jgi:hypothetical protein
MRDAIVRVLLVEQASVLAHTVPHASLPILGPEQAAGSRFLVPGGHFLCWRSMSIVAMSGNFGRVRAAQAGPRGAAKIHLLTPADDPQT